MCCAGSVCGEPSHWPRWPRPSRPVALDPARQLSQFGHRSWTQQQGLPQDSVRAIAQAPDGALWIGTDEGLARFDGTDFTVYRQSADGLPGSLITTLIAARDGSIWVGTLAGVSRLRDGRFTNYTSANGLGTPTVSDLFESADGTIWAVGGRLVTAFRADAIVNYGPEQGVPAEGLRELVRVARRLAAGRGLCRRRAVRRAAVPPVRQPGRARRLVRRVVDASIATGVLWAGTSRGLVSIDRLGQARRYTVADGVPAVPVRAAIVDRDGTLWIGTPNGLARREGDRFVRVSAPGFREGVSVWDLFEDRDGGLWVGTSSGLHRFREQQFTMFGTPEGFPSDKPTAVWEDPAGTLWIGFQDAGVLAVSQGTHRRVTRTEGLASNEVFCLRGTRDGAVLVCTRAGVSRIDSTASRRCRRPTRLAGRRSTTSPKTHRAGCGWPRATASCAPMADTSRRCSGAVRRWPTPC